MRIGCHNPNANQIYLVVVAVIVVGVDCDNVWIEFEIAMQGEIFKCEKLSFDEIQGQINFYLIWPRLNLNFLFARAHAPLRMGIELVERSVGRLARCLLVIRWTTWNLFKFLTLNLVSCIGEPILTEVKHDELNIFFVFYEFTFSVLNPFMMIFLLNFLMKQKYFSLNQNGWTKEKPTHCLFFSANKKRVNPILVGALLLGVSL